MASAHQEDLNSHELLSTHYQHPDSNHNLNPSNQNHNAFGYDSDSDNQTDQEHRDQSPEFDVYKDFNNSGVRYATLLNQNKDQNFSDNESNQPTHLNDQTARIKSGFSNSDKQEMPDYPFKRSITSPTTVKFQKKTKNYSNSVVKEPRNRWKIGSIVAFIAVACFVVFIFFLIPRQPFISFELPMQITSRNQVDNDNVDNSKTFQARNPTNFLFDARLSLALDGRASYLPMLVRNFKVVINDLGSTSDSVRVGTGQLDKGFTSSPTKLTFINANITFQYDAKNSSDTLWQHWRKACGNINQSTTNGTITRPSLQLNVILSFNVIGMIGTRSDSTQLNNVACPIELPANAPSF